MDTPVDTAADLYREIKRRGLHLRSENGRDDALLGELITKLQCPDERLQAFLEASNLSAEQFLRAFLDVAQPFARMFSDIWDFLSLNYTPKALETVAVRFGFPESADACTLSLEQFRRYVETGKKIIAPVTVRLWPFEAMHKLFELGRILLPQERFPYWEPYSQHGAYHPIDAKPYTMPVPGSASHPFDALLKGISELFQGIVDGYAAESKRRESARHLPELQERFSDEQALSDDSLYQNSLRRAAYLLTDLLPWWFYILSRSESVPASLKSAALDYYEREIGPLLKSSTTQAEVEILEALDILDLPFWRHRWHTYEVWAAIMTLRAIEEYRPAMRSKDGYIQIDGYSAAIIADIAAVGYTTPCVALQVETPFEQYGRKGIKPDLRICFSDDLQAGSTAAIVEFKQRSSPQKKPLEDMARAYSEGSPNAGGVIVINYDVTGIAVSFPPGCFLIEGVQPCNRGSIETFERTLQDILRAANLLPSTTVALLDVSGSMGDSYEPEGVQRALRSLLGMKWVKVLRFSDGLIAGGDLDESSCATIRTSGGTQLGRAIAEIEQLFGLPAAMLVITDGGHDHPAEILARIPHLRECAPHELEDNLFWLRNPSS